MGAARSVHAVALGVSAASVPLQTPQLEAVWAEPRACPPSPALASCPWGRLLSLPVPWFWGVTLRMGPGWGLGLQVLAGTGGRPAAKAETRRPHLLSTLTH